MRLEPSYRWQLTFGFPSVLRETRARHATAISIIPVEPFAPPFETFYLYLVYCSHTPVAKSGSVGAFPQSSLPTRGERRMALFILT